MSGESIPLLDVPPAVVVHYWRYYLEETEECGTIVEALSYAANLHAGEHGVVSRFELADGTVLDEDVLRPWIWLFENEWSGYLQPADREWILVTDWDGTLSGRPARV